MSGMKNFNINIASTRALILFDAAAKTGSFSRAAEFAHVGQPAISHSVRQLESSLGVKLFHRLHRGVELTSAGEILAQRVSAGLLEIRTGIEEVQSKKMTPQRITLLVSTSLASYWLMPRLGRFKLSCSEIDLRCITMDTDRDVPLAEFDLCIALGSKQWSNMQRWWFADEELFPVCSPDYLAGHELLKQPENLINHELLHLEEHYHSRFDWKKWFTHFEIYHRQLPSGWTSNDYSIVIQAALEGQGVAIGWRHIVQPLVEQGLLVRPLKHSIKTDNPFFISAPAGDELSQSAIVLRDWLIVEMANSD